MLTALETGIEGGKWFRLIDKVWSPKNLGSSLEKVVAKGGSAGVDNQSASQIEVHKEQTIAKLEQELRTRPYRPQAVKRVWILHPSKTRLVNASLAGGFDFLGYHFERGMKWPRKKSMDKLKERIRQKTRRTDGRSMRTICEDLSRTLRGGFGYFKHGKANVFESVDAYVRGRLRRILRKRNKKKGRGRGSDHQRWPNAYFTPMGLYSLKQAHAVVCRSF